MDVITRTTFHLQVSFAFFMYPIGASGNDPGRIDPVWKLLRGDVPERGPLRSGSYCGAALHRRYLMAPASAQLRVRPERKDGVHPTLCNAPPPWLRMRHQSHQSHLTHPDSLDRPLEIAARAKITEQEAATAITIAQVSSSRRPLPCASTSTPTVALSSWAAP